MNIESRETKASLRRQIRARNAEVRGEARGEMSRLACGVLRGRPEWNRAKCVLLYYPLPDELDLRPVLREALAAGRVVALPRYQADRGEYEAAVIQDEGRDLRPGWAGIPEPGPSCPSVALNRLDLVLVPGLGFDRSGRRLGRGKGFYDRLLVSVHGIRCGVAGEWQVLGAVPAEPHDEPVDCILTPMRWICCRPRTV
ncbi:MAG TPA: 5-formyltetrahydrofolate cyclo-ligase [Verrucomicrobiota bacterium]|nr:5-formyltetrahydrofolate cyclo-ligase [Verrucomicrobiota bacterium]HRZ36724.1 5-formyltetrahydrofolate cyclo-ligase [Candidatus Paceibacterota bacterium]HRZ57650.1 5-formyltetrahydrofolate cyclo-ligase [Candidatus Paceibacterota bacterium]